MEQNMISRRRFMRMAACGACAAAFCPRRVFAARPEGRGREGRAPSVPASPGERREAYFYETLDKNRVRCVTCPNFCERGENEVTLCNTKLNVGGKLYTLTYGKPCVINVDALAKNPLYHVDPGSSSLGLATAGCNLKCKYCQNWDISQVGPDKTKNMDFTPENIIAKAKEKDLRWITFSYTEPVVYLEFALEVAKLAKQNKINIAICTAGYICEKPLAELIKYADAFSLTIKGATEEFYKENIGGDMKTVWKAAGAIAAAKKWMEAVTLIVPGLNDDEDGVRRIASSLAKISADIPLHFLRFIPQFKLKNLPPTPQKTLEKAHEIAAKEGLKYVYIDLSGHAMNTVYCSKCRKPLIERSGFAVVSNNVKKGRCAACGATLPGVML